MSKYYLIEWNAGFGNMADVAEVKNQSEAEKAAYEAWREDAETNAEYSAKELTSDDCLDHGFDPEDYGLPPIED